MKRIRQHVIKLLQKKKPSFPKAIHVNIYLPTFPFSNFKISQVSDVHIGEFADKKYCYHITKTVNALKPDIVLFTGDIISEEIDNIREEFKFFKKINAPLGKFGVLGNREVDYNSVDECNKAYLDVGIKVLNNKLEELSKDGVKFNILGILENNDIGLETLENKNPTIMIAHQPKSILLIKKYNLNPPLMLCGHTHCGQIMPFGKKILENQNQPFIKGLNVYENTIVYVNCGAGHTLLPFRMLTKSEITLITINPTNKRLK